MSSSRRQAMSTVDVLSRRIEVEVDVGDVPALPLMMWIDDGDHAVDVDVEVAAGVDLDAANDDDDG